MNVLRVELRDRQQQLENLRDKVSWQYVVANQWYLFNTVIHLYVTHFQLLHNFRSTIVILFTVV